MKPSKNSMKFQLIMLRDGTDKIKYVYNSEKFTKMCLSTDAGKITSISIRSNLYLLQIIPTSRFSRTITDKPLIGNIDNLISLIFREIDFRGRKQTKIPQASINSRANVVKRGTSSVHICSRV